MGYRSHRRRAAARANAHPGGLRWSRCQYFYTRAFGATEIALISVPGATRLMHVRMRVLGTVFVLMDEIPELAADDSRFHSPDRLYGTSVSLHLQVADAESVWRQALSAGALSIIPLAVFRDELYGRLKDQFRHEWTVAQFLHALDDPKVENAGRLPCAQRNSGGVVSNN